MEIHNILLATDFSKSAESAQAASFELAKRFDSRLHVFHALEVPLPIFQPYSVAVPDAFISEARKGALEKLREIVAAAGEQGIEASSELGAVPAPADIADKARRAEADLVVVGSEGHTGIQRLLLGSVAEGTIKRAPCSVLTIRGSLTPAPMTIVVGVDFSEEAQAALDTACEFADRFGASLHLVHAAATSPPLIGPYEIAVPTTFYDSVMQDAKRRIAEVAGSCRSKVTVTTEISNAPAQIALADVADRLNAGLIVVGSQGLTGLKHLVVGSVAERTARYAPCSVWTVRIK
jgi:nucleotide-binding universal stress UspA family protein